MYEKHLNEDHIFELESIDTMKNYLKAYFIMLNLFGLVSVAYQFNIYLTIIIIPLIIFFNLWIVYFYIDIDKKQKQFILFMGLVTGFIGIILMIFSLKTFYTAVNNPIIRTAYTILSVVIFIVINIFTFIRANNKLYCNKNYNIINVDKPVFVSSGIMLIGSIALDIFSSYDGYSLFGSYITMIFGSIITLGTLNIYRYFYIKKLKFFI